MKVQRHRTAIRRNQLSRPILVALRDELLNQDKTFFDYGCGRGQDLEYLQEMGLRASGWDPAHAPDNEKNSAQVVNLGYVINVIEDKAERGETLKAAFNLAEEVLVVSAMVGFKDKALRNTEELGDGVVTQRGTFQKYFEQAELADYLTTVLKRDAYPAAQGVFYVFKSEDSEQAYCRSLSQDRGVNDLVAPQKAVQTSAEALKAISDCVLKLRRLPMPSELPEHGVILGILASSDDWRQALSSHLDETQRGQLWRERHAELVRELGVAFYAPEGGKRMSDLSFTQRADVRMVFGSMARAEVEVERYLRRVFAADALEESCKQWKKGKLTPSALYLHQALRSQLPEELGLAVDCAEAAAEADLTGDENILKINFRKPGVSFAHYLDFEEEAHPGLALATRIDFASSSVAQRNYGESKSPPILHRKELFVDEQHPRFEAWAEFTRKEEALELLGRRDIGSRGSWQRFLASRGVTIEGYDIQVGEPYEILSEDEPSSSQDDEDFEVSLHRASKKKRRARTPKVVYQDSDLDALAKAVLKRGRLPLLDEVEVADKLVKRFGRAGNWDTILGKHFDQELFQKKQRERWKHWVVYLAATRFSVTGRPKLKQLDASSRADIRAFFRNYKIACAESDDWLLKIGQAEEITNAINTYPYGLHHPDKGLYLHTSLQRDLPVVLQLLLLCARFMAGRLMPQRMNVARIAPDGKNVKFYEYKDFEKPGPATRLQSVKIDFRRRKVIPKDYFNPPKQIWERAAMLATGHQAASSLRAFEEELLRRLTEGSA